MDGNEAAARVAYLLNEVIAIYPITPASAMGEWADQWASEGRKNLWGAVPSVIEMQSEAGAAGAVHGALQAGALSGTFTASQGLLLMLPNMYKMAGELSPAVIHVAARALATQALSIFGDHSDVMAARAAGWAMLCSSSVQEASDLALVAHAATLDSRVPFMHFFDGFRTSHEVAKIEPVSEAVIRALVSEERIAEHRARALSPDRPFIRGTAHNPDTFFQAREAANPYYLACPAVVEDAMRRLAALTGRSYRLFDYDGAPDAERVIVVMGSAAATACETAEALRARGERVGVLTVRLFRPFSIEHFAAALPPTVKTLAVLDRTKEPGAPGEPLYLDVLAAVHEAVALGKAPFSAAPRVIGGRYGLASKEFTPGMAKAVFDEAAKPRPRNHFTVGILDDVTHSSLDWDPAFSTEPPETLGAVFFGLGSDGTVGANKNSIKIIGEEAGLCAQGYFVYDSKKSGSTTQSHLRFGPKPIRSAYLISQAGFIGIHHRGFLDRLDVLRYAAPGAVVLLNTPEPPEKVWDSLPRPVQRALLDKGLKLHVIDAYGLAKERGLGRRINTIMQAGFFALSGVLPHDEAVAAIKKSVEKTYRRRGADIVRANLESVDAALGRIRAVSLPREAGSTAGLAAPLAAGAPDFVRNVLGRIIEGRGDELPVSALPPDGTYPSASSQWEKRSIAQEVPVWDESVCIQCGKCVLVCPHAVIRAKLAEPAALEGAPAGFKSAPARWQGAGDLRYTLQVAPEDCTGCSLCVEVCPAKDKSRSGRKAINMSPLAPIKESAKGDWDWFLGLGERDRASLRLDQVKDVQLMRPLFEFSGACAGCGETPYLKLLSQLFGDRLLIANATGCSSIYGGNLPTTPWAVDGQGRGPAWSNSLFEDNAEFGLGMRLALEQREEGAQALLRRLEPRLGGALLESLLGPGDPSEAGLARRRAGIAGLKTALAALPGADAAELARRADDLAGKSVWIIGGDGWAYDIGYGGLDHVLASGRRVRILVLDTEVYSNTGGQMSKATPLGAVAKFAAGGKPSPKKDLALLAMGYGSVYVARVAMGGGDTQTLQAFREAEAHPGPSLIIAYSPCIAHGYDLAHGMEQSKAAVESGYWPLLRFNPALAAQGRNPLILDSKPPSRSFRSYAYNETRYTMLAQSRPEEAKRLLELAQEEVLERWGRYQRMAAEPGRANEEGAP